MELSSRPESDKRLSTNGLRLHTQTALGGLLQRFVRTLFDSSWIKLLHAVGECFSKCCLPSIVLDRDPISTECSSRSQASFQTIVKGVEPLLELRPASRLPVHLLFDRVPLSDVQVAAAISPLVSEILLEAFLLGA